MASATEQRQSDHEEFLTVVKDNEAAMTLLDKAKNRLNKFYNPNLHKEEPVKELSEEEKIIEASTPNFLQRALRRSREVAPSREEPETWSGDYKKKQAGSSGVIALLDKLAGEMKETKQA